MESRPRIEISKQLETAKEQVAIFAASRNDEKDSDLWEAYYQYWRGVRNGLLWVYYPGTETPIRSDREWEFGEEPLIEPRDLEETRERQKRT